MKKFAIEPLVGVGPIKFGMTRKEVRKHIGKPDGKIDEDREWYLDGIAIDFDGDGRVAFIEIAESDSYQVLFNGKCLHTMKADAAVRHLEKSAPYDPENPELGYSYIFPSLEISLWRQAIPDEDQEKDDPTGRTFEAVGVGPSGYFTGSIG